MRRKPQRRLRSGHGAFPVPGPVPAIVSIHAPPLHTTDEWEHHGRPFWSVCWWGSQASREVNAITDRFASTMTPTFCHLGLVGISPLLAGGVSAGACGVWVDADWQERYLISAAMRDVRDLAKMNPVQRVSYCSSLTLHNHQRYATAGDIGEVSLSPVRRCDSSWQPPADLIRMADDGCPHVDVPTHDDTVGDE